MNQEVNQFGADVARYGWAFATANQIPNSRIIREGDGSLTVQAYGADLEPIEFSFIPDSEILGSVIAEALQEEAA